MRPPRSFFFAFIHGSKFLKASAPRGRVALPGIEEVGKMPTLLEEAASSISSTSMFDVRPPNNTKQK
jgi:hypothetical protein